jgi:hypothetical protein
VNDPAFLVTRNMEDFVTWVDSSKIKRNILGYEISFHETSIRQTKTGNAQAPGISEQKPKMLFVKDFVTWVDSSKIKRNILRYREKLDDFDLL